LTADAVIPKPLSPVIVKVGGSLYGWPPLGERLREYLHTLRDFSVVIVPGGGPFANVIRMMDETHKLGPEAAHWLALRSLTSAAHLLVQLVPRAKVIEGLNAARSSWMRGRVSVLDMFRFARGDESRPDHLPHIWEVTTDSLAARVARIGQAQRLILLKSAPMPAGADWPTAASRGYVDGQFPAAVADAPFPIEAINFRDWSPAG
jgi:aspartokinase-like uncharacterized kinase